MENHIKTSTNPPSSGSDERTPKTRLKTGRRVEFQRKWRWASGALPFVGLVSLLRFLIRVIPNATAYLPTCVTEAKYLIDLALLAGHSMFGMTACGKNWFGSVCWRTNANYFPWNGGWTPSPLHNFGLLQSSFFLYNSKSGAA